MSPRRRPRRDRIWIGRSNRYADEPRHSRGSRKRQRTSGDWTEGEIRQFLFDAEVLSDVKVQGLRKAAGNEFARYGYRLATITHDPEPHPLTQLSLYVMPDRPRRSKAEMERIARMTFQRIGLRPVPEFFSVNVSGARAVVLALLPKWVRD